MTFISLKALKIEHRAVFDLNLNNDYYFYYIHYFDVNFEFSNLNKANVIFLEFHFKTNEFNMPFVIQIIVAFF